MKKIIIAILLLFICQIALADKLELMFECYPKEIQAKFKKAGIKLDLNGNDRTPNSWGFLENQGSRYNIYTYKPITPEGLIQVQKIIMEK